MSDDDKYKVGMKVLYRRDEYRAIGTIVPNFKLPGDICVRWDKSLEVSSYDPEWLDEHCEIFITPETKP